MSELVRFSRPGDPPTEFERELLARADSESSWVAIGQRLMRELGPEVGANAWAIVMDEIGRQHLFVPARRTQFEALWRDERNSLILALCARPDWTIAEIARHLGVTQHLVRQVRSRDKRGRLSRAKRAQHPA